MYSGTEEFESKYVFVSINEAKNLLSYKENQVTGYRIKVNNAKDADDVAKELQK